MGTVALMGVGCISCEQCHLDVCPRGISTQLRSIEEAQQRGVKLFKPLQGEVEAENLARLLRAFGDQIRHILAGLGERKLSALVGRTDLLVQARGRERVDLADLLIPAPMDGMQSYCPVPRIVRRPLDNLTRLISDMALSTLGQECGFVQYKEENVRSVDRAVGTYLAGAMVRQGGGAGKVDLMLGSSVPGNGLCAFNVDGISTVVEGGGQDGIAKGARGGSVCILKGANILGQRVDGSVGKSLAYGALSGTVIVQNLADSRACIRMSGADAVFGGRITAPVRDELGNIASRAHLKGFAFEYMTGGRAVVLGDPGPWICAGMTGGVIFQCLYPEHGFGRENLQRRFARGAHVVIRGLEETGLAAQAVDGQPEVALTEISKNIHNRPRRRIRSELVIPTLKAALLFLVLGAALGWLRWMDGYTKLPWDVSLDQVKYAGFLAVLFFQMCCAVSINLAGHQQAIHQQTGIQ